jgi:hypothetical protein
VSSGRGKQKGLTRKWSDPPRAPRWLLWTVGIVMLLLLLTIPVRAMMKEPIRALIEQRMNDALEGYSVRIPEINLHLRGLSITFQGLLVAQDAHPDPPVAEVAAMTAGVQWGALMRGRLVADFLFERPTVYINLEQLRAEMEDDVDLEDRGWRDALEEAYFLDFNQIRIHDGDLTYIDDDPDQPLHVTDIDFRAESIRASPGPQEVYPSPFRLEATIFTDGRTLVEGKADFLAEPTAGFHGRFEVENIPLDDARPVLARANLILSEGVVDASGEMELGTEVSRLHVHDVTVRELRVDYVHTGAETDALAQANGAAVTEDVVEGPEVLDLKIDRLMVADGEIGLVHQAEDPSFRVFIRDLDMMLEGYSTDFRDGPAEAQLTGSFMGFGSTRASATFRPEQKGPDFELMLEIQETHLPAMNDILRAYGDFDVVDGYFMFFTELTIQDGHIDGYLRPFFGDMEVYDRRADAHKDFLQQLYERTVGVIATIFENVPRDEIATEVEISGPLDDPKASTWEIIIGLVQNAFFQAILPGFEDQLLEE